MPRGLLVLPIFLLAAPVTILASSLILTTSYGGNFGLVLGAGDSIYDIFSQTPPTLGQLDYSVTSGDARGLLVEKFLKQNRSPMVGLGDFFVQMADKYGVDWKIVAAIGFQESNLGKVIPSGSFNAWGWAVYTGQSSGAEFDSWPHGIETVTRGISKYYYAQGLKTPVQMQTRYAPNSNGSWAEGVQFAMDDLED